MKRKIVTPLAVLAVGAAGLWAAPAQAALRVEQKITNHADNCSGGTHWANTDFTRTTTIVRDVDAPGDVDTYTLRISDEGMFKTVKDAPTLADANIKVANEVTGTISGSATYTVQGELRSQSGISALPDYDDGRTQGKHCAGSWWKQYFKGSPVGSINDDWTWTYKTATESLTNASEKLGGTTGNITGTLPPPFVASQLDGKTKCRVSAKDKRNVWTVSNVAGNRDRDAWYWLRDTQGKFTRATKIRVAAGKSVDVVTKSGGRLTVRYFDGQGNEKRDYSWSNYGKTKITCQ